MSFPPGTEMFRSWVRLPTLCIQVGMPHEVGSPFGHPRINDRSLSPAAFRSVPSLCSNPRHPPNALLSLHIHTTARAQGQITPHAAIIIGRQRPQHPQDAVKYRLDDVRHLHTQQLIIFTMRKNKHAHHATRLPLEDPGQRHMGGFRKCRHLSRGSSPSLLNRLSHTLRRNASSRTLKHERKWRRSDRTDDPLLAKQVLSH